MTLIEYHDKEALRDLGLRVSRAHFNGLRAPKDKIAVLQGSIACSSGLQGLYFPYFLKFEKIAMGIVWASGLQAFKKVGLQDSSDPLAKYGGKGLFTEMHCVL